MKNIGIRIFDAENEMHVKLSHILDLLSNANKYYWFIEFVDGMPAPHCGKEIMALIEERSRAKIARSISWEELSQLSSKFFQIYDLTILASLKEISPEPYEGDLRYAERYDFVATLVDGDFWEIYCKDEDVLALYRSEFKEIEWITGNEKASF